MIRFHAIAAAAALTFGGAASAQAQPAYGQPYGELPPPAYGYATQGGGGGCYSQDRFTLLGAHAGVTVLGVDAGIGAGLSVPTGEGCSGGGYAMAYTARPYAPPPPPPQPAYQGYGYQSQGYGYPSQGYGCQTCSYAPPPPPPCGCTASGW